MTPRQDPFADPAVDRHFSREAGLARTTRLAEWAAKTRQSEIDSRTRQPSSQKGQSTGIHPEAATGARTAIFDAVDGWAASQLVAAAISDGSRTCQQCGLPNEDKTCACARDIDEVIDIQRATAHYRSIVEEMRQEREKREGSR